MRLECYRNLKFEDGQLLASYPGSQKEEMSLGTRLDSFVVSYGTTQPHRRLQAWKYPGYFESCVPISRGLGTKDIYIAYVCLRTHRRTYSVQCSDKIRFPQLCIKCGIAKSCPGTHTALQAPMSSLVLMQVSTSAERQNLGWRAGDKVRVYLVQTFLCFEVSNVPLDLFHHFPLASCMCTDSITITLYHTV